MGHGGEGSRQNELDGSPDSMAGRGVGVALVASGPGRGAAEGLCCARRSGGGPGAGGTPLGSRGAPPEHRQEAGDGPQDGLPGTETRSCSPKPSPLSLLKRKCQHHRPPPRVSGTRGVPVASRGWSQGLGLFSGLPRPQRLRWGFPAGRGVKAVPAALRWLCAVASPSAS